MMSLHHDFRDDAISFTSVTGDDHHDEFGRKAGEMERDVNTFLMKCCTNCPRHVKWLTCVGIEVNLKDSTYHYRQQLPDCTAYLIDSYIEVHQKRINRSLSVQYFISFTPVYEHTYTLSCTRGRVPLPLLMAA